MMSVMGARLGALLNGGAPQATEAVRSSGPAYADPYFTLIIPWENNPALRTEWHPTERTGPFSTLSRGAFASPALALAWASGHMPGGTYSLRMCQIDETLPIGHLAAREGVKGWLVVCPCCATAADKGNARVYRANVIPYSQHCCECKAELVPGGTIRDLFTGE